MKRYIVFYGEDYYPCGGMEDFHSEHDVQQKAIDAVEREFSGHAPTDTFWAHIYDTQEMRIVYKRDRKTITINVKP